MLSARSRVCLAASVNWREAFAHPAIFRYRIDDHIHNVFDLLAILGVHRRIFLPDVVFEHTNAIHHTPGVRDCTPDPAIQEKDTRLFDSLLPERRKVALSLLERIESRSRLWDL